MSGFSFGKYEIVGTTGNVVVPEFTAYFDGDVLHRIPNGTPVTLAPGESVREVCCSSGGASTEFDTATIYEEHYAGRSEDGTTELFVRNSTMTRIGTGRWEVRFDTPHPDGDKYVVVLTSEEEGNLRDGIHAHVTQGSLNVNGFDVWLGTGDNNTAADVLRNNPFMWSVATPVEVLVPISNAPANRYVVPPWAQVNDTKANLDNSTNAYFAVGSDNWTVSNLADALNANAANAIPPMTGADYSTTVWAADIATNSVYVVSGPAPEMINLVSVPIDITVTS